MLVELEGHVTDPATAWARLGDTDFLNRVVGAGKVDMAMEPQPTGASKLVGVMAGPIGMKLRFHEHTNAWVWGRWFKQERSYDGGPVTASRFQLRLEPHPDGVVPKIRLELDPSSRLLAPVLAVRAGTYRSKWQGVLDALPKPGQPPGAALKRTLQLDAVSAFERWGKTASPAVVDAVRSLFENEQDRSLTQLRAFQVADRFGLDREETLVSMLRAVGAGALELYWSVRCRRCRGEVASTTSLSDLADHATCSSCRITFDTDLGATVEVLFAPHPAVLPRVEQRFCTVFPAGAPELRATFALEPGQAVEDELVDLPLGSWVLGPGGDAPDVEVEAGTEGDRSLSWAAGASGRRALAAGPIRLAVRNDTSVAQRVILADASDRAGSVSASLVATMAEFRRELGTQVLARDVRIGTRTVALVFTDLSGSTAMYRAIGDARAYALVRDHFKILGDVVTRRGGVVVKTIGDAVMASFQAPGDAFEASLEMQAAFRTWIATQGVSPTPQLNVGIHVGPALAVHSDAAGRDWFGNTVNLAARAQGSARGGELVMTAAVRADRRVELRLQELGLVPAAFEVELKGLGNEVLFRLSPAGA